MFYRDRLNDDYEIHQRRCTCLTDELQLVTRDAPVRRPDWFKGVVSRLADGLIAAGNSLKQDETEVPPATLSPITR